MTAVVQLVERIGSAPSDDHVVQYLNIHSDDTYSDTADSYLEKAIGARTDNGPVFSMERWCRLVFQPPFGGVYGFRFWVPDYVAPSGWEITWGSSTFFDTPTNSASSYALYPLPTSDPGEDTPNIGGETLLTGTETRYSDWIVLQAVATGEAATGPALGFDSSDQPIKINYRFNWTEN